MSERHWKKLFEGQWSKGHFTCVGLDPKLEEIPQCCYRAERELTENIFFNFNAAIVEATHDLVCAYKPNIAFYEGKPGGFAALAKTISFIRNTAPEVPIILDFKRGDIGASNKGYVEEAFEYYEVDAITLSPYLGYQAMTPFLDWEDKLCIFLCKTSNPGSGEFQDLMVMSNSMHLYQKIASDISTLWNKNGNCGLVAGATYPEDLRKIRKAAGDIPLLIPGVDKQGGSVKEAVHNGLNSLGNGIIINSSSGIIHASVKDDFAEAARQKLIELNSEILSAMS